MADRRRTTAGTSRSTSRTTSAPTSRTTSFGRYSDFFGAYWHDDDFGMGRYSTRDDKLGKKAWIWGLSRQGMIWEKLLTDTDGQYVEVQSGRLFNQAAEQSTFTPFKHRGFEPYSTDTWTEYWFPVKGTRGFVEGQRARRAERRPAGQRRGPGVAQGAPPVTAPGRSSSASRRSQRIDDTLEVLRRRPGRVLRRGCRWRRWRRGRSRSTRACRPSGCGCGSGTGWTTGRRRTTSCRGRSSRRRTSTGNRSRGCYLKGKEWMRQRDYVQAQAALEACLQKDPNYLPALADLAMVRYRAMDYQGAWDLARRGLAIDTYDPASNYYYGLASVRLGRGVDALDGFEVAASSPAFRSAAMTEAGEDPPAARATCHGARLRGAAPRTYADSLDARQTSEQVLSPARAAARQRGGPRCAASRRLAASSHFARFERYLVLRRTSRAGGRSWTASATRCRTRPSSNLRPGTTTWGGWTRRAQVLELAPPNDEVLYWLAFVQDALHDPGGGRNAPQGGRRLAAPGVPVPLRERAGVRVGDAPDDELAAEVLPGVDSVEPRTRRLAHANCCSRAATRPISRRSTPRAPRRFEPCRAEGVAGRPAARGRTRPARMALRQAAGRTAHRGQGVRPGARHWRTRYVSASPANYILGMLHAKTLLLNRAVRRGERRARRASTSCRTRDRPMRGRSIAKRELMVAAAEMRAGDIDAALRRVTAARAVAGAPGRGEAVPGGRGRAARRLAGRRVPGAAGRDRGGARAARPARGFGAGAKPGARPVCWPHSPRGDRPPGRGASGCCTTGPPGSPTRGSPTGGGALFAGERPGVAGRCAAARRIAGAGGVDRPLSVYPRCVPHPTLPQPQPRHACVESLVRPRC